MGALVETSGMFEGFAKFSKVDGFLSTIEGMALYFFSSQQSKIHDECFVEIGSYKGKSSCYIIAGIVKENNGRGTLHCVDHFKGSPEHQKGMAYSKGFSGSTRKEFDDNINLMSFSDNVKVHEKTSEEVLKDWKEPVAFIFIDGSHDYEDVRADFKGWEKHLVVGGIIALHDTNGAWDGPTKVVNTLLDNNKNYKLLSVGSITFAEKVSL